MNKLEFYKLLEKHDWYYEYSDDHRVWKMGQNSLSAIRNIAEESPDLKRLYLSYSSYIFNSTEKPEKPNE